jgi:hypothetical protein|tara:strand:- start:185 stop:388 length:204 start_codon:yes stop_codon:yes gene_type:complete
MGTDTLIEKELNTSNISYAKYPGGFILEDKFIIGAQKHRWRVKGKAKWYWYQNLKQLCEKVGITNGN